MVRYLLFREIYCFIFHVNPLEYVQTCRPLVITGVPKVGVILGLGENAINFDKSLIFLFQFNV